MATIYDLRIYCGQNVLLVNDVGHPVLPQVREVDCWLDRGGDATYPYPPALGPGRNDVVIELLIEGVGAFNPWICARTDVVQWAAVVRRIA
ncbi:hypothetical protein B5566_22590 [Mycobacterium sp. MHSD3]|uniref:Uncharacterized protein n=1 Tax=Mycobacteroides chelonae TaxID=1774 RepID=A0A1S1LY01_MYCCH|nr:hypothetical protein BKG84_26635 [Mycobacteroides chelonae]PKQ55783.1 hypothetical protein B5566_22590 [Mycobacterium sp. MHSD3]